jgi:predicted DNA-binding transcriptional regulator YafY
MKRLLRKISRLKRMIVADWQPIDINSGNVVQIITDAMAMQQQIQINYLNSGWRLILPYGWNSSKDGNVLLMCYKDTGEVRSYRLDRVLELLVDDSLLQNENTQTLDENGLYEVQDYKISPENFEIPPLPNQEEVLEQSESEQGRESPYDEALEVLTNPQMVNELPDNTNYETNNEDETDKQINEKPINEEQPVKEEPHNKHHDQNKDNDNDNDNDKDVDNFIVK